MNQSNNYFERCRLAGGRGISVEKLQETLAKFSSQPDSVMKLAKTWIWPMIGLNH